MIDDEQFRLYMKRRKYAQMASIPLEQCVHGKLYRISSRNLSLGVFNSKDNGFIGIREKFGNQYLFTEFHWDTGAPYGTVNPVKELESLPEDIEVQVCLGTIDSKTNRKVLFNEDNGRWCFEDTGEASEEIQPTSVENKKLFQWLEEKEKLYPYASYLSGEID